MAYRKYKPMPGEKVERNEELYQYKIKNPNTSYIELGKRFNIGDVMAFKTFKRLEKEYERSETGKKGRGEA